MSSLIFRTHTNRHHLCLPIKSQEGGERGLCTHWPLHAGRRLQTAGAASPWTGRRCCRLQADRPPAGGCVHAAQCRHGWGSVVGTAAGGRGQRAAKQPVCCSKGLPGVHSSVQDLNRITSCDWAAGASILCLPGQPLTAFSLETNIY